VRPQRSWGQRRRRVPLAASGLLIYLALALAPAPLLEELFRYSYRRGHTGHKTDQLAVYIQGAFGCTAASA